MSEAVTWIVSGIIAGGFLIGVFAIMRDTYVWWRKQRSVSWLSGHKNQILLFETDEGNAGYVSTTREGWSVETIDKFHRFLDDIEGVEREEG